MMMVRVATSIFYILSVVSCYITQYNAVLCIFFRLLLLPASCFEDYVASSPCFFCIVLEQQLAHQQLKASYHKTIEENCKQMRAIVPVNHDLMLQSVRWSDMQKLDRGFRSANSLNNHLAVSKIKSLNVCEVKTS